MHLVSFINNHCGDTDTVNHEMVNMANLEYLEIKRKLKKKISEPEPEIKHFEQSSFCTGGIL